VILWFSLSNLTEQTIDESNSANEIPAVKGISVSAAFQRRTLGVSDSYTSQAQYRSRAGARNGLTNEFGVMDTYQVLIQTLQLSERYRTESGTSQGESEGSASLLGVEIKDYNHFESPPSK
jgi:hypothetical protein